MSESGKVRTALYRALHHVTASVPRVSVLVTKIPTRIKPTDCVITSFIFVRPLHKDTTAIAKAIVTLVVLESHFMRFLNSK